MIHPLLQRATIAATLLAGTALGQTYQKQMFLTGLDSPQGILAVANGDVYFTEVPQPGTSGGTNQVNVVPSGSTQVNVLVSGEPFPVNLAMDGNGDLYWTCKTAGVILRRRAGNNVVWLRGLDNPTGIAAPGNGLLYITQVPTPGVPGSGGGRNTVDRIDTTNPVPTTFSGGEPEPFDVTADLNGNAYWTCKTAGVILRYNASTGQNELVLNGLNEPAGIAMDQDGNLYFTEVPDPGVFGGNNKVWKYDPSTSNLTLISVGEPEPIDISVTPDGSSVYWTCRTAGVIFRADRTGDAPVVTSPGDNEIGRTARLFLDAPTDGGKMYLAASSTGLGPISVGGRDIALSLDGLFSQTFLNAASPTVTGYVGILDANGMGTAQIAIPNDAALQGLRIFTAFAVVDNSAPMNIGSISSTNTFVIQ